MEFDYGKTFTYNVPFRSKEPLKLQSNHTYCMKARPQRFAAWDQVTKADLIEPHRKPADRRGHSLSVLEAVSAVALITKCTLERKRLCISFNFHLNCVERYVDI